MVARSIVTGSIFMIIGRVLSAALMFISTKERKRVLLSVGVEGVVHVAMTLLFCRISICCGCHMCHAGATSSERLSMLPLDMGGRVSCHGWRLSTQQV